MAAAAAPSLLAYNLAPSPTFLNQALAFAFWAWFVVLAAPARPGGPIAPVAGALGLVVAGAGAAWLWGSLPAPLALSAVATLAAAALLLAAGAGTQARPSATELFVAFCWAWLLAGMLNLLVAAIQVFAPALADGDWIAASGIAGRAVGNLRQPNHLSSLFMWALIAAAALIQMQRLRRGLGAVLIVSLVFGVVLTASRTGLVSVLVLALWGALDRKLAPSTRWLLVATPVMYAAAWFGMAEWAAASAHTFGGAERLAEGDISSSRFGIWANTLALLRAEPWLGVGFGEFNLAWTLTPFPGRPTALFDHTHNLPLQLLVELGLPLGGTVIALLLWALWRSGRSAWAGDGDAGTTARAAWLFVLMIGLHSLLEYPLWYSYFLLPAAWAWGYALAAGPARPAEPAPPVRAPWPPLAWAAALAVLLSVLSVFDYLRVAAIFRGGERMAPLVQRIESGQRSWLFAHHAHYAAVTSGLPSDGLGPSFASTTHYLLDTRLMIAWAEWLAAQGEVDKARHVAARLREFRKPEAEEFFAPCADADKAAVAFQCQPPSRVLHWREFLAR
jgi:O-antigen ligase